MKRVLIVDDSRMLANLYRTTLACAGFAVEVAPEGEAGVEATGHEKPDAMLLDVMSGVDVLAEPSHA